MASHIALNEAGVKYTPVPVNFAKGENSTPQFLGMNPLGAVPVLELDNGKVLTEGAAIMEYIAAQNPQANLTPKFDTFEYFQFRKWMNFIATELHKGFSPIWALSYITKNTDAQNDIRNYTVNSLNDAFAVLDQNFSKNNFLCGSQYTVADGYLFTIMSWCQYTKVDYSKFKYLAAFVARVGERPAVLKTIKIEEELCNQN
jgi:glutathione S-transferase